MTRTLSVLYSRCIRTSIGMLVLLTFVAGCTSVSEQKAPVVSVRPDGLTERRSEYYEEWENEGKLRRQRYEYVKLELIPVIEADDDERVLSILTSETHQDWALSGLESLEDWALGIAVDNGSYNVVRALRNGGANANLRMFERRLLNGNIGLDDRNLIEILVKDGDPPSPRLLFGALRNRDRELIQLFLESTEFEETTLREALDVARDANFSEGLEWITNQLVPIIFEHYQNHPFGLLVAVDSNNLFYVRKLIEAGGDPNSFVYALLIFQESPYLSAEESADVGFLTPVAGAAIISRQRHVTGNTALGLAVKNGNLSIAKYLIQAGAEVNTPFYNGGNHHVNERKRLTERDSRSVVYTPSTTALAMSVRAKNEDMIRLLLQHGANPNQPDGDGRAPHMIAEELGLDLDSLVQEVRSDQ